MRPPTRANPSTTKARFIAPRTVLSSPSRGLRPRLPRAWPIYLADPEGGDVLIVSRITHDWEDGEAITLLTRCRAAMAVQGRLLLVERLPKEHTAPSPEAQGHALSDLNILVHTGGRERRLAEYGALLGAAGFRVQRVVPTGAP